MGAPVTIENFERVGTVIYDSSIVKTHFGYSWKAQCYEYDKQM